jgi:hypothetical protein
MQPMPKGQASVSSGAFQSSAFFKLHGVAASSSSSENGLVHEKQLVDPRGACFPTEHVAQALAASESTSAVPASHGLHSIDPAREK